MKSMTVDCEITDEDGATWFYSARVTRGTKKGLFRPHENPPDPDEVEIVPHSVSQRNTDGSPKFACNADLFDAPGITLEDLEDVALWRADELEHGDSPDPDDFRDENGDK